MKFRKGKCSGVWFLWPVVIYYRQLGIEIRYLKWLIGVDWGVHQEIAYIPTEQALKG